MSSPAGIATPAAATTRTKIVFAPEADGGSDMGRCKSLPLARARESLLPKIPPSWPPGWGVPLGGALGSPAGESAGVGSLGGAWKVLPLAFPSALGAF
jgi:hypothetical protein